MRAVTDTQPAVDFDNLGPGVQNLLGIFQAFAEWPDDQMRNHFHGKRYGDLKKEVAEMVLSHLEPFQERYRQITADPSMWPACCVAARNVCPPSPTTPCAPSNSGWASTPSDRSAIAYPAPRVLSIARSQPELSIAVACPNRL